MVLVVGCLQPTPQPESSDDVDAPTTQSEAPTNYNPPQIPAMITSQQDRVEYMAGKYWDNFDFRDTTLLNDHLTERAYAIYLQMIESAPLDIAKSGVVEMMRCAAVDTIAFGRFTTLAEKYLYDPNSPFRSEELYIPVLESMVDGSSPLDEMERIRPQYQLDMVSKNRVGSVATDFSLMLENGGEIILSQIDSDYTILFFNNPGCVDCNRVKGMIEGNGEIFDRDNLTILSVYTDQDIEAWRATEYPSGWINGYDAEGRFNRDQIYDLRAIPNLYLLDREKRVIFKDATIESIAEYLYRNNSVK